MKFQKKPFRGERIALEMSTSTAALSHARSSSPPPLHSGLPTMTFPLIVDLNSLGAAADTVTAMRGIEVARKSMAIVQSGPQSLAGADIQLVSCLTECVDREVLSANVRVR